MRWIAALVRLVPMDSPGRRAVDEVLADWRHEVASVETPWRRAAVTCRALCALAVALTFVTFRDVRHAAGHSLLRAAAIWLVAFSAGAWIVLSMRPPVWAPHLPPGVWEQIKPGWMVVWAGWFVPLAFFAAASFNRARADSMPVAGFALLAFLLTMLVDGWLVPLMDAQAPGFIGGSRSPVFHELTSMGDPTLSSVLLDPRHSVIAALHQLNETLARGAAAAGLVMLAGTLKRRRMWTRIAIAVVVGTVIYTVGYTASDLLRPSWSVRLFFYERLARTWIVPTGLWLFVFALAGNATRQESTKQPA